MRAGLRACVAIMLLAAEIARAQTAFVQTLVDGQSTASIETGQTIRIDVVVSHNQWCFAGCVWRC